MDGDIRLTNRAKLLNHLALHYRAGDSELVVGLFRALGLRVEDLGPARNGDRFFKVIIDASSEDGFFFVATAAAAQLAFEQALTDAFPPGSALDAYRQARLSDPEAGFHVGVRYESFEAMERAVQALEALQSGEPRLAGRLAVTRMKPRAGSEANLAARIAASPIFAEDDREAFNPDVVQIFIQTDLVAGGLLALGQTIELDYVFPNRPTAYAPVAVYDEDDRP